MNFVKSFLPILLLLTTFSITATTATAKKIAPATLPIVLPGGQIQSPGITLINAKNTTKESAMIVHNGWTQKGPAVAEKGNTTRQGDIIDPVRQENTTMANTNMLALEISPQNANNTTGSMTDGNTKDAPNCS